MWQQMEFNRCTMRDPDSQTKHDLPAERPMERKYSQGIQTRETNLDAGGRIADALRNVLESKYVRILDEKLPYFSLLN